MTPEEDKAIQQAHAERIRQQREAGRGGAESKPDPAVAQLKSELPALKSRMDEVEGARVCGVGFSGDLKSGISFDPNAAGLGGAGGGGPLKRVIIVDNGVANYYDITATFVSAV